MWTCCLCIARVNCVNKNQLGDSIHLQKGPFFHFYVSWRVWVRFLSSGTPLVQKRYSTVYYCSSITVELVNQPYNIEMMSSKRDKTSITQLCLTPWAEDDERLFKAIKGRDLDSPMQLGLFLVFSPRMPVGCQWDLLKITRDPQNLKSHVTLDLDGVFLPVHLGGDYGDDGIPRYRYVFQVAKWRNIVKKRVNPPWNQQLTPKNLGKRVPFLNSRSFQVSAERKEKYIAKSKYISLN